MSLSTATPGPEPAEFAELAALWPQAYQDLRQVAHRLLQQGPGESPTLAATALVNEAYLRLAGHRQQLLPADRQHFFTLAVRAMRQVLVAHAQARRARHGDAMATHLTLSQAEGLPACETDAVDLLAVHQALQRLAGFDERAARVTELKVFGGLETAEIAELLAVSEPTVKRDWLFARTWMARRLAN